MTITKENYKTLVWDESIPHTEYFDFIETLSIEEKVVIYLPLLMNRNRLYFNNLFRGLPKKQQKQ